jgi:hypothetical protein
MNQIEPARLTLERTFGKTYEHKDDAYYFTRVSDRMWHTYAQGWNRLLAGTLCREGREGVPGQTHCLFGIG